MRFVRPTIMIISILLLVGLFAGAVWPTPWRDRSIEGYVGRINRFSGEAQILCADGWHALVPDPFADMAKTPSTSLCQVAPMAR